MAYLYRLLLALSLITLAACSEDAPEPVQSDSLPVHQPTQEADVVDDQEGASGRPAVPYLTEKTARARAQMVSAVGYDLTLNLPAAPGDFSGHAQINFDYKQGNEPLTVDFRGGEVSALRINGQPTEVDYNGFFLSLPEGVLVEGSNNLLISFSHPYGKDGSGLHRFDDAEDGRAYVYTDFEPYDSHKLFPQFDQPDLKASYILKVTVPADWRVVSAARETNIVDNPVSEGGGTDPSRTWIFPETQRFSTYLISLHAGPYRVWEDNDFRYPLRVFARQSVADQVKPEQWFDYTRKGFDFFDAYYEVPYPFAKYDQVIVPDFNAGAMENVAAVTFTERLLRRSERTRNERRRLAGIILHEMAHMWFGDLVTMRWWNDLWLNEAFATYMATIALAEATEFDDTWQHFFAFTKQAGYLADNRVTTHAIDGPVDDTYSAFARFDAITYRKGAAVLHQLAMYLGPEQFRLGVSRYLKEHSWSNTELTDFMGALGEQSGLDLSDWTVDWLQRAGTNQIVADYECSDGMISRFELLQSAPSEHPVLRTHRLQVGFYNNLEGDEVVEAASYPVAVRGERTALAEVVGQTCPDLVYPNHGDWSFINARLDPASLSFAQEHLARVSDPLLRSMLWQAIWDMTWDVEIGMDEFIGQVLANLPGETDLTLLRQVSENLAKGMDQLLRGGEATEALLADQGLALEEMMLNELAKAPPQSDLARLWFDALVNIAHSKVTLDWLEGLLSGENKLEAFTLDQDRRWNVILRLSQFGVDGVEQLIAAEVAADASDQGRKKTLSAKASLPGSEHKKQWLGRVQQGDDKLSELKSIMQYLFRPNQVVSAVALATDILDPIGELHDQRDAEYLSAYARYLIPNMCSLDEAERLQRVMDQVPTLSAPVTKRLLEHIEDNQRCVRMLDHLQ